VLLLSPILCAVLIVSGNAFPAQIPGPKRPPRAEKFVWRYGGHELGTLDVAPGFTADSENYREGIVTRLRYPDGSCFVLQSGFMYRIPLFQGPKHILDSSEKMSGRTVRRGHYPDRSEVWGEVGYEPRKSVRPAGSRFEIVSRNLGCEHVPVGRGKDFARTLDSSSRLLSGMIFRNTVKNPLSPERAVHNWE
jgi:hypothetical protein